MIDPSLKSGKFSVSAENVDAPTLARLYDEERANRRACRADGRRVRAAAASAARAGPGPAARRPAQPFAPQDIFAA